MALTASQLAEIMAPVKTRKGAKTNALVRLPDGTMERQQVKSSQFGKYEGKAGTKRRSRKGLVRTMPNGYINYNDIDSVLPWAEVEVVAYTV